MKVSRFIKNKPFLSFILALVLVLGVVGGTVFGSTFLGWPDEYVYQVAVNPEGKVRLLGPNIKGRFNSELRENEFLIELPSIELIEMLNGKISDLETRIAALEDLLGSFIINVTADSGGLISPSGAVSVNHGEDQSFTITPDEGYHILDVLIDGSSVGAVSTYTFSAVTADHTIEASFAIDSVLPEGLVLRYQMDEGGGSVLHDMSEFGNDGVIVGATWGQLPTELWYLDFDGIDDYVSIPNSPSIDITDAITIKLWFKIGTISKQNYLLSKGENQYTIIFQKTDAGKLQVYHIDLSPRTLNTTITLDDSSWYQVVTTYDKDVAFNKRKLYINGSLDNQDNPTSTITPNPNVLTLASYSQLSGYGNAHLALIEIYNRSWTASEVQNSYDGERHLFGK